MHIHVAVALLWSVAHVIVDRYASELHSSSIERTFVLRKDLVPSPKARRASGSKFRESVRSVLVARCKNGYRDKTRSSPGDRIGSENPDLVGARTEGSNVVDGRLQRAARIPGRDSTTTRVDLEFAIRICPRGPRCHAFKIPLRRAAKRSSSSCGSDSPPQPRTNSRIPAGMDSSSAPCLGRGAPCFPVGRVLPPIVRTPLPITAWWVRCGLKSSFRGRSSLGRGIQACILSTHLASLAWPQFGAGLGQRLRLRSPELAP